MSNNTNAARIIRGVRETHQLFQGKGRSGFRRWPAPTQDEVRELRQSLGLSQREFSSMFGFELETLRKWEQGKSSADQASSLLFELIRRDAHGMAERIHAVDKTNNKERIDSLKRELEDA